MKRKSGKNRDPRLETPPGHFLRQAEWLPETNGSSANFFSLRDTLVMGFLLLSCLIVGAILWLRPPKYISFDKESPTYNPSVSAKNIPKQLKNGPGYDSKKFEEIPDDDPSITGDEADLPLKEPANAPLPRTIKSDIQKALRMFLAAFGFHKTA